MVNKNQQQHGDNISEFSRLSVALIEKHHEIYMKKKASYQYINIKFNY